MNSKHRDRTSYQISCSGLLGDSDNKSKDYDYVAAFIPPISLYELEMCYWILSKGERDLFINASNFAFEKGSFFHSMVNFLTRDELYENNVSGPQCLSV